MLSVEIYEFDAQGKDVTAGTISHDGATFHLEPKDRTALLNILQTPCFDVEKQDWVEAEEDPRAWMSNLRFQYRGYLRAGNITEKEGGVGEKSWAYAGDIPFDLSDWWQKKSDWHLGKDAGKTPRGSEGLGTKKSAGVSGGLPHPNFTGTITDSLGRKQTYVNGEHVQGTQEAPSVKEGTGGEKYAKVGSHRWTNAVEKVFGTDKEGPHTSSEEEGGTAHHFKEASHVAHHLLETIKQNEQQGNKEAEAHNKEALASLIKNELRNQTKEANLATGGMTATVGTPEEVAVTHRETGTKREFTPRKLTRKEKPTVTPEAKPAEASTASAETPSEPVAEMNPQAKEEFLRDVIAVMQGQESPGFHPNQEEVQAEVKKRLGSAGGDAKAKRQAIKQAETDWQSAKEQAQGEIEGKPKVKGPPAGRELKPKNKGKVESGQQATPEDTAAAVDQTPVDTPAEEAKPAAKATPAESEVKQEAVATEPAVQEKQPETPGENTPPEGASTETPATTAPTEQTPAAPQRVEQKPAEERVRVKHRGEEGEGTVYVRTGPNSWETESGEYPASEAGMQRWRDRGMVKDMAEEKPAEPKKEAAVGLVNETPPAEAKPEAAPATSEPAAAEAKPASETQIAPAAVKPVGNTSPATETKAEPAALTAKREAGVEAPSGGAIEQEKPGAIDDAMSDKIGKTAKKMGVDANLASAIAQECASAEGRPVRTGDLVESAMWAREGYSSLSKKTQGIIEKAKKRLAERQNATPPTGRDAVPATNGSTEATQQPETAAITPEQEPAIEKTARVAFDDIERKLNGASVPIPDIVDAIREKHPEISENQVHDLLLKWQTDDKLVLQAGHTGKTTPNWNRGIPSDKGQLMFVDMKKQGDTAKETPTEAPATTASSPTTERLKATRERSAKNLADAKAEFERSFPSGKRPAGKVGQGYDDRLNQIHEYEQQLSDIEGKLRTETPATETAAKPKKSVSDRVAAMKKKSVPLAKQAEAATMPEGEAVEKPTEEAVKPADTAEPSPEETKRRQQIADTFFNEHHQDVLRSATKWARSISKSGSEADDIAQEASLTLLKAIRDGRFDPSRDDWKGFVHKAVVSRTRDLGRKNKREKASSIEGYGEEGEGRIDPAATDHGSEEKEATHEEIQRLKPVIAKLPQEHQDVINFDLTGQGDYPKHIEEMAGEEQKKAKDAYRKTRERARKQLRKLLEAQQ
jgi:RNA polymerase sigma factor (sigma-70 family)